MMSLDHCPYCQIRSVDPARLQCLRCARTLSIWEIVNHGTRPTPPPAHGSADPSSGASPGASLTAADIAAAKQAIIAATLAQPNSLYSSLQNAHSRIMKGPPLHAGYNYRPAGGPALDVAGTTVGELVGWRIWQVLRPGRLLMSYSAGHVWLPSEPMEGEPDDHGVAGVWAFKYSTDAALKARELHCGAFGSVWLWGEVVEHELGGRAQFAEVRSIDWAGPASMPIPHPDDPPILISESLMIWRDRKRDRSVALPQCDGDLLAGLRRRYGVGSDKDATTIADMVPERKKSGGPG